MCALPPPFTMATPAASLLAGFDFNLTSQTSTPESLPANPAPPKRPPTPDPRHTPRPHPSRTLYPSSSSLSGGDHTRRLRRKPTAIFLGNDKQRPTAAHWTRASEAEPLLVSQYPSEPTLTPLLPLPPSTPSPRFATSPSLSSSGTTVQSSPTLTPTTAYFGRICDDYKPPTDNLGVLDAWDISKGTVSLRRAKRLPHREQGIWEVHAVVHVSAGTCGKEDQERQWKDRNQETQAGELITEPSPHSAASANEQAVHHNPRDRHRKAKGFHSIRSESASREGALRTAREADTSTYSLSRFHFPAPPGNYYVGLGGDVQHPTKVHYRGASFDLVNPHASLLLSSSHIETPAEIDGLLDDYFEDSDTMPRALYSNPDAARRNIMGLDGTDDAADATTGNNESAGSLVPPRVPSDPFDLHMSDGLPQAAQRGRRNTTQDSTIAELLGDYEYTREALYEHEDTLRLLESGVSAPHSEVVFSQLPETVQQHMSDELSLRESELPTSERTYGDTNELLGLAHRRPNAALPGVLGSEVRMRPAPGRSTTATTIDITRDSGLQSAQASLHNASSSSPCESPASNTTERPRGTGPMYTNCRELSESSLRSNDAADWETTRSESHPELPQYPIRPSQESYANTSTFSETNRLSAMSYPGAASNPVYELAAGPNDPVPTGKPEDVEKARSAFKKIYKNKGVDENFLGTGTPQQSDGGIFNAMRNRGRSALLEARENDIELEEIRRRNPYAVRLAAEQFVAEQAAESPVQCPKAMPMERLRSIRSFFSRGNLDGTDQRENRAIMDNSIPGAHESDRNLLAQTPSTEGHRSRLEHSDTVNTFRTIRGDSPTPWARSGRRNVDLAGQPISPAFPAAAYSPEYQRVRPGPRMPTRAPPRTARQAAISSQTSLQNLIISDSPTSNIQGAFTDREMFEASRRWRSRPTRRYNGNASEPFPHFPHTTFVDVDLGDSALRHPDEVADPHLRALQERLSKWYLVRMLPLPPLCFLYNRGYFDYLIAKKTNGRVKEMSAAKKYDAAHWGAVLTIAYALIVVGIVSAVMLSKK
ncbi:hypothetical protein Q7P37_004002 [Cladosporium fusiforme]